MSVDTIGFELEGDFILRVAETTIEGLRAGDHVSARRQDSAADGEIAVVKSEDGAVGLRRAPVDPGLTVMGVAVQLIRGLDVD